MSDREREREREREKAVKKEFIHILLSSPLQETLIGLNYNYPLFRSTQLVGNSIKVYV